MSGTANPFDPTDPSTDPPPTVATVNHEFPGLGIPGDFESDTGLPYKPFRDVRRGVDISLVQNVPGYSPSSWMLFVKEEGLPVAAYSQVVGTKYIIRNGAAYGFLAEVDSVLFVGQLVDLKTMLPER